MMNRPLLIPSMIQHADRCHRDVEIVSVTTEGPTHRYTWGDCYGRVQQLANVLEALGVEQGDRVATLAWNSYRHLELYYGISSMGAVCHTVNPRLFKEQLVYIFNHAEDRFIFVDVTFVPLLEGILDQIGGIEGFVVMTDEDHMPETTLPNVHCYETLMAAQAPTYDWPDLDENTASALCYTSGTTGNPKGTLYSHRSTVLHAFGALASAFSLRGDDTVMPVVPLFHVQSWGIPHSAPIVGAKLVFNGPKFDGETLQKLLEDEQVTVSLGVPTIWLGMLEYLRTSGKRVDSLRMLVSGGAAPPHAMIEGFDKDYGVPLTHGWGMTETSPVAAAGINPRRMAKLNQDERITETLKQGQVLYGVEIKIVDDEGNRLPHDGETSGELYVRGPWVTSGYFNDDEANAEAFDDEGWFRTGDVAAIEPDSHIRITDRAKDLIKSGGEWISSIDLENTAVSHPDIAEAAAIAMPHPKWTERPLLVVVPRDGGTVTKDSVIDFLDGRIAKWWMPDDVVFTDELPHTATGKIAKLQLREIYKDYVLPTV
ncbi:MAG: long-chain-fatty-acid--CoA ligase [Pseudomonadota bacterium]|nr:long-chain-fatty-acid--CoA ligase [Pseudomonadota bacterium]